MDDRTVQLQPQQMERFAQDGFVVFRQFLHGAELQELIANVERYIRDVAPIVPQEHVFYEDRSDARTLKQMQNLGEHDSWFARFVAGGAFRTIAEQLLGSAVIAKNLQYFSKPPGVGLPTPPHQDGYYFMLDPCDAVTMWLALDDVDETNGCVRYVTGSHRTGMRPHGRTRTLGFSQGIQDYPLDSDSRDEVAILAKPGDLLVHHAMTIHRADGNASADRQRRALGLVYYGEHAKQDSVAHAAYQDRLAAEMKAAGRL